METIIFIQKTAFTTLVHVITLNSLVCHLLLPNVCFMCTCKVKTAFLLHVKEFFKPHN